MIERGEIWWVDPGPGVGSGPAKRRPVLVIQSDAYNRSALATVVVAVITSNTSRASLASNVFLASGVTGLQRDSVVNTTQLYTLDRDELTDRVGFVAGDLMAQVDQGLRRVLGL